MMGCDSSTRFCRHLSYGTWLRCGFASRPRRKTDGHASRFVSCFDFDHQGSCFLSVSGGTEVGSASPANYMMSSTLIQSCATTDGAASGFRGHLCS